MGALLFTTRTGVALAFHSTFVYLLTPTINAFVLAGAFAGSALLRRPLTERFALAALNGSRLLPTSGLLGDRQVRHLVREDAAELPRHLAATFGNSVDLTR